MSSNKGMSNEELWAILDIDVPPERITLGTIVEERNFDYVDISTDGDWLFSSIAFLLYGNSKYSLFVRREYKLKIISRRKYYQALAEYNQETDLLSYVRKMWYSATEDDGIQAVDRYGGAFDIMAICDWFNISIRLWIRQDSKNDTQYTEFGSSDRIVIINSCFLSEACTNKSTINQF